LYWNKKDLQEVVRKRLSEYSFLVVSNREPYIHSYSGDSINCSVPASGLTIALDPIMQTCKGTWVAHGSGDADKKVVDDRNRIKVPPENPIYTLRRVWLSKEEEDRYYSGFSNEALWPLCHIVYTRPKFDEEDWNTYKKVNELFAEAVLDEIRDKKAFLFIQDYHLALLSRLIKKANKNVITAQFWHIPWPNREAFRICPWQEEILDGLLGNDLIGFHIAYHRDNFIETVERTLECKIDHEKHAITRSGQTTQVHPFPISVDFDQISEDAGKETILQEMESLKQQYGLSNQIIGAGIDRIDYTKGIPERLIALDKLFSRYPYYRGKVVFFQLSEPSRIHIKKYRELNAETDELIETINWKYRSEDWKPVIHIKEHLSPDTLHAFRRIADFFIVSSLHDGMNLVAKEYVASRIDEDGVLILSRFTGAARELTEALLINPYATDEFAEKIREAIEMSPAARRKRMHKLREIVQNNNIYRWAGKIATELSNIEMK
jgi:alpha,alpha-trehalose-phosphate synthase [UDP-forming]